MNDLKGKFITFEGGEGAGKTTLVKKLAQELEKRGLSCFLTREPNGSLLGDHIRSILLDATSPIDIGAKSETLLFLAARAQNLKERIVPALDKGKIVLCDRFNDSTVVYQGYARGLGVEQIQKMCDWTCSGVSPDLTFLLDVDPKIGFSRFKERDKMESEGLAFHYKIREGFLQLAKAFPERFHILDASESAEQVFSKLLQRLTYDKILL